MEAGPGLDALIAGQVMGWELLHYGCPEPAWFEPGKFHSRRHLPAFSTDIAAAWLIVEKLQEQGYAFGLWTTPAISSVLNAPLAAFERGVHPPAMYDQNPEIAWGLGDPGDTNPALAICRAALRVLREE